MSAPRNTSTKCYQYDPLDRLISAHSTQRFYNSTRIATETQDGRTTCFFEQAAMPLAELHPGDAVTLLATDLQKTVLHSINHALIYQQIYSPYGHRSVAENGLLSVLGFNGERPDVLTGHYLLGQGHRAYNPVLMRFNSPDSLSPFGEGGLNTYAYCENNPINYTDPSGKIKSFFMRLKLYNEPKIPAAVSRVIKSLGSIKKTKPIPTRAPKKTVLPNPQNVQQTNALATNGSPTGRASPHRNPSTPAYKAMDTDKTYTAQSRTALAPIHNFASPDEWRVRLNPGPLQSAVSRQPLRPIGNYALPGEWDVRLTPDAMQPIVILIRKNI